MNTPTYLAFEGPRQIAAGPLAHVAVAVKHRLAQDGHGALLVLDATTAELRDLNTQGSDDDVARRYTEAGAPPDEAAAPRGRGRPRLGVVAREVTLLPRHWEWLADQPGGASVALRKLVEDARRANAGQDTARQARESAYRFMSAIASGFDTFEEATRALFAGDRVRFELLAKGWPEDVGRHAIAWAEASFTAEDSGSRPAPG